MLTGLLLGAGASYDVGMPLVWELTSELKAWLTPEKLRDLNKSWRADGHGYPDEVIDSLASVLEIPSMHYESILGFLEASYRRDHANTQAYHGLYSWLVELVYWVFYLRHTNNSTYIQNSIRYLEGIVHLAQENTPLWIFSLNHDLMIECLAAQHHLQLSSGFSTSVVTLPRRNAQGAKIGELRAEVITGEHLEKFGMPFLRSGSKGINLLKIHGSLDVFTFRDGNDLLKLLPVEQSLAGVLETLRAANNELLYIHECAPEKPIKTTNEIAYADDTGEMNFLRRTLLAGAFKFDSRRPQVLPVHLLRHFHSNINTLDRLISIGYSFGDIHINQVIRDWLEHSVTRQLEIVDPGITSIPAPLSHLAPQISLSKSTATDYLDKVGRIVRSKKDLLEYQLGTWIRRHTGGVGVANNAFEAFLEQYRKNRFSTLIEKLKTLPFRDGDIDIDALGITQQDLIEQLSGDLWTAHDAIEAFLMAQDSKT